jgi:O-antigen/teichoic acid export membrane protein
VESTEKRFLQSLLAAGGSQLGRTVLRLIADLTLARLVLPEGHGLFALAWSTVVIAGFVRDLGLPYELVRDPEQPYGTVLVWEVGAGVLVTAGLVVCAPLFGGLDPDLPRVMAVLALWVLIEALAVVPRVYFERQLQVTRLVGPEILRGLTFATTSIALAANDFGVWSFVFGELFAASIFVLILWLRVRGRMPLAYRFDRLPRLLWRSGLLFVIALVANATPFVGRYIVEIVDTTFMVGQFEKAFLWAFRAQILVIPALVRVIYPALVTYRSDHSRFVGAFRLGTVAILSLEVLVAYFLFFNAEIVILKILLGENWREAVHLIRILCFLPLVDPFNRLGGEMLKAYREDRLWLVVVLLNFASLVGFGWLLSQWLGTDGMAWAHYLMVGHLLMAWRVYQICGPEFWRLVKELTIIYLLPLPFFLAISRFLPAASWSRFAVSLAAVAVIGGILAARFSRPFREFFLDTTSDPQEPDPAP